MLFGCGALGGNEKTDHSALSTKAAAIVARRVDMAAVMVSQPCCADRDMEQVSREREQAKCYPCGKGLERSRQL